MREMKDSGVEWIGEIPQDWNTVRLKTRFNFGKGLPITKENLISFGIPVLSYGQVHSKINNGTALNHELFRFVDKSYLETNPQSLVHKGDFIVADTSEDIDGCGNCAYVDSERVLFAGYHTIILFDKEKRDNKYLAYFFQSNVWRNQVRCRVSGVKVFSISRKILSNAYCIIPSVIEQHAIAQYLDEKCAKVDTLIANVQAQIEKLKAYKQSLITEVVTKGLDPTVPMKDSGVEWIGEIPEHWRIQRIKYIGATQNGISKGGEYFGSGYPFVSYGDVYKNMELPYTVSGLVESTENERANYSVKKGDIFFTRTSESIEEVGFSSVCTKTINNATFAGFLIRLRPFKDVLITEYSKYYFRGNHIRRYLVKEMNIVTRASLGQGLLKAMPVLIPSHDEQTVIAEYLDKKCSQIDRLIGIKQEKITKLEQYKRSLIYEYVTGKKEVK